VAACITAIACAGVATAICLSALAASLAAAPATLLAAVTACLALVHVVGILYLLMSSLGHVVLET